MSRDFDWPEFLFLLGALRWTVVLSLIAFVGGGIGGLVLALARTSSHAILRWLAAGYIGLMQGTPVLMQLFLAYYGLAVLTGIRIDPWPAVTLAFTMYAAAFLGLSLTGGLRFNVIGSYLGVLLLGTVTTGLTIMNQPNWTAELVQGGVLLAAVAGVAIRRRGSFGR